MSTAKVYLKEFAILDEDNRNSNDHTSNPAVLEYRDFLCMRFDDLPEAMQFKRISAIPPLTVYISKLVDSFDPSSPYCKVYAKRILRQFDPLTATYNNSADLIEDFDSSIVSDAIARGTGALTIEDIYVAGAALNNGVMLSIGFTDENILSVITQGINRPYITIEVDDSDTLGVDVTDCTPSSGNIARTSPVIFAWTAKAHIYDCSPATEVVSSVLQWRAGSNGEVNNVQVPGAAKTVTIPANTFTADEIQWRVVVTANSGVVTTTDWMTLSTLDVKPEAKVVSPRNTVVDATADNVFMWDHIISTGTAQTKAELQKSVDGETWTTLTTVTSAATQWTCPAGTLTSAIKYWRVRTYNADGVASDWSEAAQIVVISAPPTPVLQIQTAGPRPAVSWQTSGQQASQVAIDGVYKSGTIYGVAQQWSAPMYLDDGDYTIRVRAQNEYGLWSEWGIAALQVVNVPGAAVTLSVRTSHVAELEWTTTGAYDFYLIYRDGVPVVKTTQRAYTDALSIGPTTYQVRGCYAANGNYGISEQVPAEIAPPTTTVSDLDTGTWLSLPYAATPNRKTSRESTRTVNYLALSGIKYPYAEVSDNYTDALTIEAACTDTTEARALEALVGRLVCAKTPMEDMVVGYLDILQKDHDGFVTTFTFTIQQIDYTEEVQL